MTRVRAIAVVVCAVIVVALMSLYPLHIDGNQDCGGVTGRVALVGSYNSGGGEQTPQTVAAADKVAAKCQTRARTLLGAGAVGGALVGFAGAALWDRRRRGHVEATGSDSELTTQNR